MDFALTQAIRKTGAMIGGFAKIRKKRVRQALLAFLLGVALCVIGASTSSLPPWACGGKEGFVKQCGKCVGDSQCEEGLFCCPTLRVCMHSRTDRCRKPYNVCTSQFRTRRPEYADEITWARECEGPSLSEWMQCP